MSALGRAQLAELVKIRGQGLQGVEVLGATVEGDAASVRVGLLTFQPEKQGEPPPKTPTASRPATFAMRKEGDEWRFSEPSYLSPMIKNVRSRQNQKQQGGSSRTSSSKRTPKPLLSEREDRDGGPQPDEERAPAGRRTRTKAERKEAKLRRTTRS